MSYSEKKLEQRIVTDTEEIFLPNGTSYIEFRNEGNQNLHVRVGDKEDGVILQSGQTWSIGDLGYPAKLQRGQKFTLVFDGSGEERGIITTLSEA